MQQLGGRGGGGAANDAAYTFQQPPQGMLRASPQPCYRDPASRQRKYGNIMYDRRVYRGNTYASSVVSRAMHAEQQQREAAEQRRREQSSRRAASVKRQRELEAVRRRLATPRPVEGRQHIEVQTSEYLEALVDAVETQTQATQTDPLLDRPPTPVYVPQKTGRDAETQIHEGDLFHFDEAVEPLLEVMVGKTLEQAMLEVMQEEELELLRQQQLEYEQRRKEELLEMQRLEAEERRRFEEKERRKQQELERMQREKETREKLQARQFAKAYMLNLEHRVFARLQDEGWFADRTRSEVELQFMPWLTAEVERELRKKAQARALVDALIAQAVQV